MSGTLRKERTSFSLSATGASLYDSANVNAHTAGRHRATDSIRRPSDRINFNGRLDHALNTSHTLRANLQSNGNEQSQPRRRRLRPGRPRVSRARPMTRCCGCRRAARGRGTCSARTGSSSAGRPRRRVSDVEARTVRVLDTFTNGGAQQAGGRDSHRHRMGDQRRLGRGASTRSASAAWSRAAGTRATTAPTISAPSRSPAARTTKPGGPANYTQRIGDPLRRVLAVAGRPLHPGRLAGAIEPDAQRRAPPGVPDAPRRPLEPVAARGLHLVTVQARARRPCAAAAASSTSGSSPDVYEQTLRVDGVAAARPGDHQPRLSGCVRVAARRRRSCRRAGTCSPTTW